MAYLLYPRVFMMKREHTARSRWCWSASAAFLLLKRRRCGLRLFVGEDVCSRDHKEMAEMVQFSIVARPSYLIREHSIHVWDDLYRHIYEALTKDKAKV